MAVLGPDLALLQETNAPAWVHERWTVRTEPHESWTSALVARPGLALQPIHFERASVLGRFGSYLAIGDLALPDGSSLLVASIHTRATVASAPGTAGLDRTAIAHPSVGEPWWNDVAFAGYRELAEGRRFLLGGDWNTSRWLDVDGVPAPSGADGREGKTWFGSTNPQAHQPDHLFADLATAALRPGPDKVDIPSAPSSRRPGTRPDVRS